ncbi:MAG: cell surface protein SprA, partial [Saprospiraceae bacterium]
KATNQETVVERVDDEGNVFFDTERNRNGGGTVYIDDFEGSASNIDLRIPANKWVLASVPRNDDRNANPLFPEGDIFNDRISNINRAHMNWYSIDQSARSVSDREMNPYTAGVPQTEVFRNAQIPPDQLANFRTFDLTYYPKDRGSYNYDTPRGTIHSAGISETTGELKAPESRWAGIMREITGAQNFEAANVESIQFWMMSPFIDVDDENIPVGSEGDLYFNLGNISEDILYDGKPMFERALPGANAAEVEITSMGRVPSSPPRANGGFDNSDQASIIAQDVGLDGANDTLEAEIFNDYLAQLQNEGLNQNIINEIRQDPSKDNYVYYNNNNVYDDEAGVWDRYYNYNHTEGNSPPATGNDLNLRAGTQIPDSEDINNDNSLNTTEAYWQYKVPIRRDGDEIDISSNPYIVDRVQTETTYGGKPRYWYRFKIPLTDTQRKSVGGIQDFRSIRFIRMYLNGFRDQTTLRFARLELVRNQWRTYVQQPLTDPGVLVATDSRNATTFDVTAINIEQNSEKEPFPYVLPLGIQREQSIGVFNTLQNEQSLALEACNLGNGDARAIYKLVDLDLRVYERIKMFVHAESLQETELPDNEISVFVRLGSDFNNNYYEYEIPLQISDSLLVSSLSDQALRREIWKVANELDFPLRDLLDLKLVRNNEDIPLTEVFSANDTQEGKERNQLKVKGNPNLGNVKSIMIGIRNIDDNRDDNYCAEVWVNELRLSGLDERVGLAATSRMDIQLADLGNVTLSGNLSTIGFGSLEESVSERQRESVTGYDVAANIELGKFLPENSGIKVPFYAQYSNTATTPEYDPYDFDVVLSDKLATAENAATRDSIREQAQTRQTIKSYAFTNVRKERTNTESKPMPWDISNFSFTYAHNETKESDPIIQNAETDEYRGAVDYAYSRQVKYIEPLKKVIKKDKYLKFLSQMNFNPIPNSFSFNTVMDRQFAQTTYRFTEEFKPAFQTFYNKFFTWDRNYNVQWDLTKNLKFNFNASAQSVIDEPEEVDFETGEIVDPEFRKEVILDNIRDFGRPKNYQHQLSLNYTLPFKYFPFLDWINVKAQYSGNYNWAAASLNTVGLGNVIQNQQTRSINGDLNFEKLYGYSKYLKKINSKPRRSRSNNRSSRSNRGGKEKEEDPNSKKKKKKANREPSKAERIAIRPLMLLRKARFNYSENFGTVLPGFRPETEFFGQNEGFESPGWDFVAGLQPRIRTLNQADYGTDRDWLYTLSQQRVEQGLESFIVDTVFLNQPVQQTYNQSIDAKVTIEPFNDFRLDLEAGRQFSENHTEFYKDPTPIRDRQEERDRTGTYVPKFERALPIDMGTMDISYFALNTFWQDSDDEISALFRRFEDNRVVISRRLGEGRHDKDEQAGQGFTEGYGKDQRDVLLPAFIAAYTDQDAEAVPISDNYARNILFKELPRVNWRLTYNGLAKVPFFKQFFQSVNISHGYRSNLTVNSFQTNQYFLDGLQDGQILPFDNQNEGSTFNFYSRINIPEIVIQEQFAPLLAFDMRLQNDMSLNLDFKKARTLAMNFDASILNETQSEEYTVGFAYRIKDFEFPFMKKGKRGRKPRVDEEAPTQGNRPNQRGGGNQASIGDLDMKFDFSFGNNVTFLHEFDKLGAKEPTRGERTIRISPSADYQVNEQLTLVFFFDYNRRIPRVSSAFPITNTRGGVTVRFSLN